MLKPASMKEILHPRGIALVGVSPSSPNGFASSMTRGLIKAGFENIYPINPKYKEAFGLPCFPSIKDVPAVVDHVVVAINAKAALSLIDDCTEKGVKSIHFWTAGFGETGNKEGAELEKTMLQKARAAGIRLFGPNAGGIFVPRHKYVWSPNPPVTPGPISFLSQSGGHSGYLPLIGAPRGLFFSNIVSYGNAIDVNECDILEYFMEDPDTKIIGTYIEGVRDGKRFFELLRKAAKKKPVVIHKGGSTEAGKRASFGHTASLTSSVKVFNTVCKQAGAIQTDDMDELRDVLVALRFATPVPKGLGVLVIGQGGGASVWASDEIERAGLKMPPISPAMQSELKKFLPEAGGIFSNPLDNSLLFTAKGILATGKVLGQLPEFDMLMFHIGFHPKSRWGGKAIPKDKDALKPIIDALLETKEVSGKPLLIALGRPLDVEGMQHFMTVQEALVEAKIPVFYSLNKAAKAMSHVVNWHRNKEL
jgi:acyl-CoA synthetase (NDP forming)